MKKTGISLLFCFLSIVLYSQQESKGALSYEDNTPVSFVDILILENDLLIQESSTNENGLFSINLNNGKYTIQIEENGMLLHTQEIVVNNKELGVIFIPKNDNISLAETLVAAQKKMIKKEVDRLVFNPNQAEAAKGGNALDALKLAPRVKVDENSDAISIVGKGSVSVLINNRLMQMDTNQLSNYLKTIRTEDIEKIEVITNPPAKFDASGNSGVINIVLKNTKQDSLNGSLSTSVFNSKYTGLTYNGNINYRKGKWTLIARSFIGDTDSGLDNYSTILYETNRWNNISKNRSKHNYYGTGIGIDYNISESLITGFNLDLGKGDGEILNNSINTIYDLSQNTLNRYISTDNNGSEWDWKYVGLNYHIIKKFNNEGKKLTFDFDYSKNTSNTSNISTSNEFNPDHSPINNKYQSNLTNNDFNSNRFNFSIDMEHPLDSWTMNYGTRIRLAQDKTYNRRFSETNGYYLEDDEYRYNFSYDENIYALFYTVEKQFSEKWSAKVGLRYEHADVKAYADDNRSNYSKTYTDLFPTAYVMYEASDKHSYSINYSRRIDRPTMWFLNPMLIKQNDYSYQTGNPNIAPAYSNNIEIEHAYKDLFVTSLFASFTDDVSGQISEYDPETQIAILKPYNFAKTTSIGLSENINLKILKWWKINASADIYYIKSTGKIPSMNYSLDGLNGDFSISNNLELNKAKTLFANYTYSYSTKGTDSDLDEYNDYLIHNAGIRAMIFNKKLQLSFNVNNIFENHRPKYISRNNDVLSTWTNEPLRTFRFSIAYNFGKQFQIERSKSNQEQSNANG